MSKLSKLGRKLWLRAELATSPAIQQRVLPYCYEAKGLLGQCISPYLQVNQWTGEGQRGRLMVNFVGAKPITSLLKNMLFVDRPEEIVIDAVPAWRPDTLANLPTGDITIVEANKHLIRCLPRHQAFVMPAFVEMSLDVRGSWEEVKRRFRKRSVRSDLRLTRKYDYQYEISRTKQDFETFYREMYLPMVEIRHAERGVPMPINEAYEYFQRGFLFFITRGGERMCASLFYLNNDTVYFILVGIINGNQDLMKQGAIGALNALRIRWANQEGYSRVNFGWYRSFMTKLFSNKRKWGLALMFRSA